MLESIFTKKNEIVLSSLILASVIIAAYSPIVFLNQSYNQSWNIHPTLLGDEVDTSPFNITIDPGAAFRQNWPVTKLATDLFKEGKVPLWNPYIGGGAPLAADTINYIFTPLMIGFLLPVQLWDVPLLAALWIAGFTMFLFLRSLGLNFPSSIAGGIFYMLSGAFTWYLPHTHVAVMMFTPLILYSIEKIIQNKNPKYIALVSVSISLGILGAHLESIILQMLLAGLYLTYRIVYLGITKHRSNIELSENKPLFAFSVKRVLLWSALGFIGGLGLTAFYILPVYEYIDNAQLSHGTDLGSRFDQPPVLSPIFTPYIFGQIHTAWSTTMLDSGVSWDSLWGYVSAFTLFFSILGVYYSIKNKSSNLHKYTPLFFLAVSAFFIMKTVGIPIVNWIGYLPVF